MMLEDPQLLVEHPEWAIVLQSYVELADQATEAPELPEEQDSQGPETAESASTGPRWFSRIEPPENWDPEELARIHGQLIAHGWLQFNLEDGKFGLSYRISSQGRKVLSAAETALANAEETPEPAADSATDAADESLAA